MDTLTSLKKVKEICRSCHYMDYYLDEDINCSNCGKSRLFEMRVVPPEQTTLTYIYRGKSVSFTTLHLLAHPVSTIVCLQSFVYLSRTKPQ